MFHVSSRLSCCGLVHPSIVSDSLSSFTHPKCLQLLLLLLIQDHTRDMLVAQCLAERSFADPNLAATQKFLHNRRINIFAMGSPIVFEPITNPDNPNNWKLRLILEDLTQSCPPFEYIGFGGIVAFLPRTFSAHFPVEFPSSYPHLYLWFNQDAPPLHACWNPRKKQMMTTWPNKNGLVFHVMVQGKSAFPECC